MSEEYYLERAAEARAEAEASTLANVRERCLRSEEVWLEMARRAARARALKLGRDDAAHP